MSKSYSVARVQQHTAAGIGKSERHIERKNESYENMNVDLSRTPMNVHFKDCGELTYNACLDKLVTDGTVSLRGLKKDAKVFDEMIFDVNTAYFEQHGGYEYAKRFYEEVFRFAEKEYGPGNIISAVMHADELNTALTEQLGHPVYHYHMHVVALPVVEKEIRWSKRCKDPALVGTVKEVIHQVSHSKKWASQKVTDENGHTQIVKSYSLLQDRFFEHMQEAGFRDFDRGERGSTAEHLSVIEYKTKKESERLAGYEEKQSEVQMEISALTVIKEDAQEQADAAHEQAERATEQANAAARRINELAPKLKNIEDFAREFSDDADKVLPEAGALESAKVYREKKAKPVYEKIVKVLRSLFNKYLDLKHHFERLTGDYNRLQQRYASLDQAYERVKGENKELKTVADDYDALCRGFGREKIAASVQAIRDQEAAERQQRRARHRHEVKAR
jgi:Plasmid recombination enzyme.